MGSWAGWADRRADTLGTLRIDVMARWYVRPMSASRDRDGRVALVTGVSRSGQIAEALVDRLRADGITVVATGWPPHDAEMPWGESPLDLTVPVRRDDFDDAATPQRVIDEVIAEHGRLDIVVATHARSSHKSLADVTADELDRCWRINVRSVVLLAQRLAEVHDPAPMDQPPRGRLLWFTSGQHLGPMDSEIAYAVSKGALHQMTASIDHGLAPARVIANCINPGPVDTGWADDDTRRAVGAMFPDRRWGEPSDIADLVSFLVADAGAWLRGQVLNAEGGFDRFARHEPLTR
jgi:3-oxoacyl-[acyl-carrier protein] reductase